jgi:tRNA U38,U39,U40 pseudouridine synthase TruA
LYRTFEVRLNSKVFTGENISANAFLHHKVRNIAGVLMTIGGGEQSPVWARTV